MRAHLYTTSNVSAEPIPKNNVEVHLGNIPREYTVVNHWSTVYARAPLILQEL